VTDFLDRLQAALAGRYRLERDAAGAARLLGRGGMASVYLARDLKHGRHVALKVLLPELTQALVAERFLREIEIASLLNHPHILPLHDSGSADGLLFYVMPYIAGESLRRRLARERHLPVEEAIRLGGEIGRALDYAHEQGVIHRDIKPENILLQDGQALVADFGISRAVTGLLDESAVQRLTETGLTLGTPAYMSPEQAAGDRALDGRSDLYSLGCVVYEMLAGQPPFIGPTAQAVLARHALDPVPPIRTVRSAVPEHTERAVTRALGKVPADRFDTAEEFALAMLTPGPLPVFRAEQAPQGAVRRDRRVPREFTLAATALAVAGAVWGWRALRAREAATTSSNSVIAVLPFAPTVPDSMLTRLGKDLAVTLSSNLDGVGDIQAVNPQTVLSRIGSPGEAYTLDQGRSFGRQLGAGRVIHGSLVRLGPSIRLELGLFTTASGARLARVSVTSPPESVLAIADSATQSLLRQVWRKGEAPTPSAEAALQTRSAPALRAFLEGERAMLEDHWKAAAEAYTRAIEADSTLWLAYARRLYARAWKGDREVDSQVVRIRARLPERDRLLVTSFMELKDSIGAALSTAEQLTLPHRGAQDYWLGWLHYGQLLLHYGPHFGRGLSEARDALQRAVMLAPNVSPAWERLAWIYLQDRDTAGADRAIGALDRLGYLGDSAEACSGGECGSSLLELQYLNELVRTGGSVPASLRDSVIRQRAEQGGWSGFTRPFLYGFQRAMLDVNRRAGIRFFQAEALASGGAWDSAMAELDYDIRHDDSPYSIQHAYGFAVAGALVGAIDPAIALRRGAAARRASPPDDFFWRPTNAYLDGVMAWLVRDRRGMARAREFFRDAGTDPRTSALAPMRLSLDGLAPALDGDIRGAARRIAALERTLADITTPGNHFMLEIMCYDRLALSRWLLALGDSTQALKVLTWHEAYTYGPSAEVIRPLVYLHRARIEDALGWKDQARRHYQQFLWRYDMPDARLRHLVDEARGALARLDLRGERAAGT
jgi:serine/threonine protein kinase/tetratricopeptide (TPR) repeat protein